MAQSTNPNNANRAALGHVGSNYAAIDANPGAHQRCCHFKFHIIR